MAMTRSASGSCWELEHRERFEGRLVALGWRPVEALPVGCPTYLKGGVGLQLDGWGLWVFEPIGLGAWSRTRGLDFAAVDTSDRGARDRGLDEAVGPFADGQWLMLESGKFEEGVET